MKKSFNQQISDYESSITDKIDGSIASYLAGLVNTTNSTLTNNLQTLEKNYNVYWSNQTTALSNERIKYMFDVTCKWGMRLVTNQTTQTAREALIECSSADTLTYQYFPVCTSKTVSGTKKFYIDSYAEKLPYIHYKSFYIYNTTNDYSSNLDIKGEYDTKGFNPNSNITARQLDSWWDSGVGDASGGWPYWCMTIWGFYETKTKSTDEKSIYIYPNAGTCYPWDTSNTTVSTGTSTSAYKLSDNSTSGSWAGNGSTKPTNYTGKWTLHNFTKEDTNNMPWCHITTQMKDMIDNRIKSTTGVESALSEGVLITTIENRCSLSFSCSPTADGILTLYLKDSDKNVKKTFTKNLTTGSNKVKWDLTSLDFDDVKTYYMWLMFSPSSKAELKIGDINATIIKD